MYGAFPVCRNYTVRAYLRNAGTAKWSGRQNRQQYARALRRRIYTPHLHPRYEAEAGRSRTNDGQLHGTGHVSRKRAQKYRREGKASSPVLFEPIRTFSRVGHGVGQAVCPHFDSHHFRRFCNKKASKTEVFDAFWSCWADSNCRPHPYQGCALPTELQQHIWRPRRGSNPRPPA